MWGRQSEVEALEMKAKGQKKQAGVGLAGVWKDLSLLGATGLLCHPTLRYTRTQPRAFLCIAAPTSTLHPLSQSSLCCFCHWMLATQLWAGAFQTLDCYP